MPTVAFVTLGCKTNQFESVAMQEQLKAAGYETVHFEEGADLVIVNTCTVTAATDSQSRNLIRRARRLNNRCRVIVTGCYAQVNPDALAQIPGVSVVIGNDEKHNLANLLATTGSIEKVVVADVRRQKKICLPPLTSFSGRSRAFVQIQNGCDSFCSYCIIPYARGASRSVSLSEVTHQVQALVDAGYPEIVLTGIHIGCYGIDLEPKTNLAHLLHQTLVVTDGCRLRLGSIEPNEISDELIDLIANTKDICPHWHIPLQSGDSNVLKRMGRSYDDQFFYDLIAKIVDRMPTAGIGLDVIAGFPGETDAEFSKTMELIHALPISYLHVFPFSRRPGTPAAKMSGQVPKTLIKARAEALRNLGAEKRSLFAQKFIGRQLQVVVESGRSLGLLKGIAGNYLDIYFPGTEELSGLTAIVKVVAMENGKLIGTLN
ncbi:MAG: tRNA (N(6)-L-threonylcarbamoyladenosine(37)-C(2))-methylthiotransferase MtaB [Deltaproteobacteria bacterium]|nr:tRNA (N(6)-L-threonylcarbamoyladenosine(37)-C(2))-methylthiotransferase MtaB [Deltaproteobacteria bacterium]